MKITDKMLSLPPYISTTWDRVEHIRLGDEGSLVIVLASGYEARIVDLEEKVINAIFAAYERWVERQNNPKILGEMMKPPTMRGSLHIGNREGAMLADGALPFQLPNGAPLEHNPNQRDFPDIPKEIVEKIARVASIVAPADPDALPKAEPHCNCMFCQIARAITNGLDGTVNERPHGIPYPDFADEEPVKSQDLTFSETPDTNGWKVEQSSEDSKLYQVSKEEETYKVILGETIGCTCGNSHCEHIEAVLRS